MPLSTRSSEASDTVELPVQLFGEPVLLAPVFGDLFEEGVVDLIPPDLPKGLALGEDDTVVLAACDAVVGVPGLTRTVYYAAHDGDGEVVLEVFEPVLDLRGHPDHVEAER